MSNPRHGKIVRDIRTLFDVGAIGNLTDGQLLERFARGRGEAPELAFAALAERHGPMVLRVCRSVLRDEDDARDAYQVTFLTLVKKARSLWVRDSLGPWLHGVALRVASRACASAVRRHRRERVAAELAAGRPARADAELVGALHEEIDRLPRSLREPLVLCDLEGRSREHAARHVGCPVGTVKGRLARGRRLLARRLARRGLAPAGALAGPGWAAGSAGAAVPAALADATILAATRFAASPVAARAVGASAAQLFEEVQRAMFLNTLKVVSGALVALVVAAGGAGVAARQVGVGDDDGGSPTVPADAPGALAPVSAASAAEDGRRIEALERRLGRIDSLLQQVLGRLADRPKAPPYAPLAGRGGPDAPLDLEDESPRVPRRVGVQSTLPPIPTGAAPRANSVEPPTGGGGLPAPKESEPSSVTPVRNFAPDGRGPASHGSRLEALERRTERIDATLQLILRRLGAPRANSPVSAPQGLPGAGPVKPESAPADAAFPGSPRSS